VGSCRRDLLDHVIALNERPLKRLLAAYLHYYHDDRTHLGLGKETPSRRPHCQPQGPITVQARLGGLHHRYDRARVIFKETRSCFLVGGCVSAGIRGQTSRREATNFNLQSS